ncbi:hypothetical protein D9758_002170 [Tetrapyrgos nigripes]|uniref:ZZ-type domain-containing protein n=1 Tax=Tetrapyrgos nigripes TaxID=182062 RepID=A0A8H5LT83_9AGAR|nr:hypothetical protein D9758_002170 [Tetrapyrgos nigripes]
MSPALSLPMTSCTARYTQALISTVSKLYRVFPISHDFFLSKLLFSPDSSKSRILIAREVHAAEDYVTCTSHYAVGYWPNPLLKFTVLDETPHKLPNNPSAFGLPQLRTIEASTAPQPQNPFGTPIQFGTVNSSPFHPISFSHIPPPPIIFSSAHSSPQASAEPEVTRSRKLTPPPQPQSAQTTKTTYCCAPTQRKEEVKELISTFKSELDRIVAELNDMSLRQPPPVLPTTPSSSPPTPPPKPQAMADPIFPSLCQFNFCSQCGVIKQGPWYHCGKCDNKICVNCHDASTDTNCLVATGPHVWKMTFCPSCPEAPTQPVLPGGPWNPTADSSMPSSSFIAPEPTQPMASPRLPTLPSVPTVEPWNARPDVESRNVDTPATTAPSSQAVHVGVMCDVCHSVIEGVRHKCLDCPDYDLCTNCITSGSAERHNPFHEFIEIHEPGRVIVHTVLSGNGEREATQPPPHPSTISEDIQCLSTSITLRNFITHEQHPHHGFVRLTKAEDFIRRPELERPAHFATCNICTHAIFGVRYKCMHPDCPDVDLCESCEAHPIAVHPSNHPLLKLKNANTRVPVLNAREPVPVPVPARTPVQEYALQCCAPSVFENGQIRDTVEDLVYQPPSPFFFRTETGGSNSPIQPPEPARAHDMTPLAGFTRERSPSPLLSIPGALPDATESSHSSTFDTIVEAHVIATFAVYFSFPPVACTSVTSVTPHRSFRDEMHDRNTAWRFSEFQPTRRHTDFDPVFMHGPAAVHERPVSPEQPEVWRFLPKVPSRFDLGQPQPESFFRQYEPPITLPPIRSTDSPGLWPETLQEMRHLTSAPEFESSTMNHASAIGTSASHVPAESPLGVEALLNSPPPSDRELKPEDAVRSLAAILNIQPVPTEAKQTFVEDRAKAEAAFPELPNISSSTAQVSDRDVLSAEFVVDKSVPDGQEFPPGAEFMKSWCMFNAGNKAWPMETALVFVAGEDLSIGEKAKSIKVGSVPPGETVDIWTGELKAPDAPGRYVGYYRLRDENGVLFGHSIWLDIIVSETHRRSPSFDEGSSPEEYSSLSSSSIVVMPQSAPSGRTSSLPPSSPPTSHSSPAVTAAYSHSDADVLENISNPDSETSSVSMVSVPSLSEEEDEEEELYRDCRSSLHFDASMSVQTVRAPVPSTTSASREHQIDEYVVLYDEVSSSEGEN